MDTELGGGRYATTLEVTLIALTLVCLPVLEAPKNIFSVLFIFVWLIVALRSRSFGSASPFELPITGLAVVLWLAPMFSDFGDIITPLNSAPRWTLLAVFVLLAARLNYSRDQAVFLFLALMAGGGAAVVESLWVWSLNGKEYPEFRSVGHVNHSSMYSLITLAVGVGALHFHKKWLKAIGLLAIISTLVFLPVSRSLVGGLSTFVLVVVGIWTLLAAAGKTSLRRKIFSIILGGIMVAGILATPPAASFRDEVVARVTFGQFLGSRDKIFNTAWVVWDRHPIFGTGMFSFGQATSENEVRAALFERGRSFDVTDYDFQSHGHNLWTTILIERGLVGVVLVTVLLLLYFRTFASVAFSTKRIRETDRGAATAALLVAVGFAVAGLGNTTMMNEHGQAGMTVISVAYGYLRRRRHVGRSVISSWIQSCNACLSAIRRASIEN